MNIKRGNKYKFNCIVKNKDGETITNLSTALNVIFAIKLNEDDSDDDALVLKDINHEGGVVVDVPTVGSVQVSLSPADTVGIDPGFYFIAIQIEWPGDDWQEIDLKDGPVYFNKVEIVGDIIRG